MRSGGRCKMRVERTAHDVVLFALQSEFPRAVDPEILALNCQLTMSEVDDALAQLDHAGLVKPSTEGMWRARGAALDAQSTAAPRRVVDDRWARRNATFQRLSRSGAV